MALDLAQRIGGEIVNADSMQLYADLQVLTARPSAEEAARVPHHLYGVADGSEAWSAGRWLRAAQEVLADIAARSRAAVVVGGTGLYFRALTGGLADIPAVPESVRAEVSADFDRMGEGAFRNRLRGVDPKAEARIATGDRQRLVRAFEVFEATRRSLTDWQVPLPLDGGGVRGEGAARPFGEGGAITPIPGPSPIEGEGRLVLEPPRDVLYARCDERFDAMVQSGALEEVRRLTERNLDPALPAMKALGVRELARHLSGDLSLAEATRLAQQETRRYAKRQMTWFRNQTPDWPRAPA